ncbi:hypothetical protein CCACVL1_27524 [Corchorus capsularis]|uniref:Uncharacterized protein n=1 Tax=Corchorus capsularis TaxID=210143 RepID=A0A1R3G9S2_COCAP|nr:hypothetical protein CCACVL1_27524 [Corchorus capsularis]
MSQDQTNVPVPSKPQTNRQVKVN